MMDFLYLGVDYARGDRSGGDIAWINPTNNATGSLALLVIHQRINVTIKWDYYCLF